MPAWIVVTRFLFSHHLYLLVGLSFLAFVRSHESTVSVRSSATHSHHAATMSEAEAAIEQSERLGGQKEGKKKKEEEKTLSSQLHANLRFSSFLHRYKTSNRELTVRKRRPSFPSCGQQRRGEINYKIPSLRFRVPSIVSTVPLFKPSSRIPAIRASRRPCCQQTTGPRIWTPPRCELCEEHVPVHEHACGAPLRLTISW